MRRHRRERPHPQSFTRYAFPIAVLGALLAFVPGVMGQRLGGGHFGGFSSSHMSGFSGGGVHGGFSTPPVFRGFSGSAPRAFGAVPRMNWTGPRYGFAPQRQAFAGYRAGNRGDYHRDRYRPPYPGYRYSGYPYLYANSWELLPWDLGYPDFIDYDNSAAAPNNAQAEPSAEEQQEPPGNESYQPAYAPETYQPQANRAAPSSPPREEPELTLIFKDGHTQAIRNYVLTPSKVIVMDDAASGRMPSIPLSDLNLAATEKGAQRAGLEFSPPSA